MSITLQVTAASQPPGTCYPPTWNQALQATAASLIIQGLDNFSTFSFGPNTPATDAQNAPWIKTDSQYKLIGIYTFTGGSWQPANPPILPGHIIPFFGTSSSIVAPYYVCDGSVINGSMSGTLTTPNLQGLTILGTGTNPTTGIAYANQSIGGGSTVLTAANIPAHPHGLDAKETFVAGSPGSGQWIPTNNGSPPPVPSLVVGGNSTGDGNPPVATPTIPPYMAMYWTIFWP